MYIVTVLCSIAILGVNTLLTSTQSYDGTCTDGYNSEFIILQVDFIFQQISLSRMHEKTTRQSRS